jgi:hypothetical protein
MTLIHLAKPTTARTDRTHQQKRGRPLAIALAAIGATAFLADRVDIALFDDFLDF